MNPTDLHVSRTPRCRLRQPAITGTFVLLFMATAVDADRVWAEESPPWPLDAETIVFLGDSNTNAGGYIEFIELHLRATQTRWPQLINLGLSSETCSGLSETDHPFPRPNVHERLDRALAKAKPDVVVVCYGMNDAIYAPFDEQRFAEFRQGMCRLIDKTHQFGAKVVLLTPPPFDPQPFRRQQKLRPEDSDNFAWFAIYEGYDQVIQRYAEWLMTQDDQVEMIIDVHTAMKEFLQEQRRLDPQYEMSNDGVHFNSEGHEVVGRAILEAWQVTPAPELDSEQRDLVHRRQRILHDAWLSHVGHQRPGVKPGLPLQQAIQEARSLLPDARAE